MVAARVPGFNPGSGNAHEVRSLVEALWLGGCYDQLNMPSLASFEAIGRRLQTMVEAYANSGGGAPDWAHALLFTGTVSADHIVSGDLRSWAGKKGKEEVELIAARSKLKDAGLWAWGERHKLWRVYLAPNQKSRGSTSFLG